MSARHGDPDSEANDPNDLNYSSPEGDESDHEVMFGPWLPPFWPEPVREPDCTAGEDEYDRKELDDLTIAIGLLTGAWTQQGATPESKEPDRYPAKRYLAGELEGEARHAIGRLLRNRKPLDMALRYQLAELFDGLPPYSSLDAAPMARRIVFENRRAGQPAEVALRDLHLVSDYWRFRVGGRDHKPMVHQDALDEVCKKYDVSTTTVKDARKRNPQLEPRAFKKRIDRPD
jgi:hypothetical protein